MIKTYLKTLWRMFEKHITRFLSIIFMVLVSVGFVSGVGSATDKIKYSLNDYYGGKTGSDYIIKSTEDNGFSEDDIQAGKDMFPNATVNTGMSLDIKVGEKRSVRYYFLDFDEWTVNKFDTLEGKLTDPETQVYVERADNVIKSYAVGDEITVDFKEILTASAEQNGTELNAMMKNMLDRLEPKKLTVGAVIQSPLLLAHDGEPSYNNDIDEMPDTTSGTADLDCLENVIYVSKDLIPTIFNIPILRTGDIYVAIEDRATFDSLSQDYKKITEEGTERIKELLVDAEVLTLFENYGFKSLVAYSDKVQGIGYLLMVAFLLVTALVVLSTMTRLLDEERSQIACLKTLGYSSTDIISKYMLFALLATGIGGAGAYFVGLGLAYLICYVFNYSFAMPPISSKIAVVFYVIIFLLVVAATLAATVIAGYKMTDERPANLLRPKPPRAGKKVILEKIPFLWNRLSFKYKSTMRNVLRYKSRFFMTVIAVAFSTSLVMAGLGLLDMCLFGDFGSGAIMGIAAVIVVFAGLLTAVVIYTLTNINISERNREIATLMVLGYQDREVTGYIYREVYINSIIGVLAGYPLSALMMWFMFGIMSIGSVGEVSWFMWLIAPFIVLMFTGLVTLILRRKIVKIDMNESLKAIE